MSDAERRARCLARCADASARWAGQVGRVRVTRRDIARCCREALEAGCTVAEVCQSVGLLPAEVRSLAASVRYAELDMGS